MGKRTTQTGLSDWEDTSDLEHVVKDKRAEWRGTPAKGRRRNRRYENRILRSQSLEDEGLDDDPIDNEPWTVEPSASETASANNVELSDGENGAQLSVRFADGDRD